MKRHVSIMWLCVFSVLLLCAQIPAEEFPQYNLLGDNSITDVPNDVATARFDFWLPDNFPSSTIIRGVFINCDYQADQNLWDNGGGTIGPDMQCMLDTIKALAAELKFARMQELVQNPDNRSRLYKDEYQVTAVFHALDHFAEVTGHAELQYAPVVWFGLSQSGGTAYNKARRAPDRTITIIPWHAASSSGDFSASHGVPTLSCLGGLDGLSTRANSLIPANVEAGALWTPFIQKATQHQRLEMGTNDQVNTKAAIYWQWLRWAVATRLPEAISGAGTVQLTPLDKSQGYYVAGNWTGDGSGGNEFRWESIDVYPATADLPANAKGWVPAAIYDIWKTRSAQACDGAITMHGEAVAVNPMVRRSAELIPYKARESGMPRMLLNGRTMPWARRTTSLIMVQDGLKKMHVESDAR